MEKKSDIQSVVDLLEENGFHVFEVKEDRGDFFTGRINDKGTIQLLIAPYKEKKEKGC